MKVEDFTYKTVYEPNYFKIMTEIITYRNTEEYLYNRIKDTQYDKTIIGILMTFLANKILRVYFLPFDFSH